MCGRYVSPEDAAIEREFTLVRHEWQVQADGKSKQPYYLTLNDQDVFGFAGLWDSSTGTDGVAVEFCTIVTMPANKLMTEIHNVKHRMPAILSRKIVMCG